MRWDQLSMRGRASRTSSAVARRPPPAVRDPQFLVQFALQPDRQQILCAVGILAGDVPADADGVEPMQPLLPAPGGSLEEKDPIAVADDQVWDDLLQRRILLDVGAPAELTVAADALHVSVHPARGKAVETSRRKEPAARHHQDEFIQSHTRSFA